MPFFHVMTSNDSNLQSITKLLDSKPLAKMCFVEFPNGGFSFGHHLARLHWIGASVGRYLSSRYLSQSYLIWIVFYSNSHPGG